MDYIRTKIDEYLAQQELEGALLLDIVADARLLGTYQNGFWNFEEGHRAGARILIRNAQHRFIAQHFLLLAKQSGVVAHDIQVVGAVPDGESYDYVIGNGLRNLLTPAQASAVADKALEVLKAGGEFVVGVLEDSGASIDGETVRQELAGKGFTVPGSVSPLPETDEQGNYRWLIVATK